MTVPKFRAWDIHEKKMITNEQIIIWNNNVYANDGGKLKPDKLMGWSIDDKYLMQSTGQKDCNNSKIFDADILLEPWTGHVVGRVFYSLSDLAWKVLLAGGGQEFLSDCLDLQVCGNIYANPDLLEGLNDQ